MKYPFLIVPGLILLVTLMLLMATSAIVAELELVKERKRLSGHNTSL